MSPLAIRLLLLSTAIILCFYFFVTAFTAFTAIPTPSHIETAKQYAGDILSGFQSDTRPTSPLQVTPKSNNKDKLAYVTFLSGTMANASDPDPNNDPYFVATRLLGYQLMHQPKTRTQSHIPFLILVTPDIPASKRARLSRDGATIIEVEYVETPAWVTGGMPQWADVMTKLRAWQLSHFTRALFLDGDTILNGRLDGVFAESNAQIALAEEPTEASGYADVPDRYLLASIPEANPFHAYPPHAAANDFKDHNYFNAGFFLFGPSQDAFEYYFSFLAKEGSFDPMYPEQNLLNEAHRRDRRMPWKQVDVGWNIRFPALGDKEAGVVSMHDKWWRAHMDPGLQPYYDALRWRMEGFYEGRDMSLGR